MLIKTDGLPIHRWSYRWGSQQVVPTDHYNMVLWSTINSTILYSMKYYQPHYFLLNKKQTFFLERYTSTSHVISFHISRIQIWSQILSHFKDKKTANYKENHIRLIGWKTRNLFSLWNCKENLQHSRPVRNLYTQRNIFEILINQTEIRLYLPFFDWSGTQKWYIQSDFGLI